jgi:hypothetical protein
VETPGYPSGSRIRRLDTDRTAVYAVGLWAHGMVLCPAFLARGNLRLTRGASQGTSCTFDDFDDNSHVSHMRSGLTKGKRAGILASTEAKVQIQFAVARLS